MKKIQTFRDVHLSTQGIQELDAWLTAPRGILDTFHVPKFFLRDADAAEWELETFEEFMADYHASLGAYYERSRREFGVIVLNAIDDDGPYLKITVQAPHKSTILAVSSIIENNLVEPCEHFLWEPGVADVVN